MTPAEAATVLALASGVDGRKHGEAQARVWARILGPDVTLPDALEAVEAHYATSEKWLMPVHVIDGAKQIRDHRAGLARRAELDAQIEAENQGELHNRPAAALTAGRHVPADDAARAERRAMLRKAAHTKQAVIEADLAAAAEHRVRREQARAELHPDATPSGTTSTSDAPAPSVTR